LQLYLKNHEEFFVSKCKVFLPLILENDFHRAYHYEGSDCLFGINKIRESFKQQPLTWSCELGTKAEDLAIESAKSQSIVHTKENYGQNSWGAEFSTRAQAFNYLLVCEPLFCWYRLVYRLMQPNSFFLFYLLLLTNAQLLRTEKSIQY